MFVEYQPCCYYPTEIIFLDDNGTYLSTLDSLIRGQKVHFPFKFFHEPSEALDYINTKIKTANQQAFINRLLKHVDTFQANHYALEVDVSALHKEIYNPNRFQQISVVVADYNLGKSKNGLDFCKQILDKNIQKILLTGQSDKELIIDAFNEGIIQHFILKQGLSNIKEILQMLFKSQNNYFRRLSKPIYETINNARIDFPLAIGEVNFKKFFNQLLQKHKIVEYYLVEPVGSYLLLDQNGHSKTLFVQNLDQHKANVLEIEDEIGATISKALSQQIKEGKQIFCYPSFINPLPEAFEWAPYFHNAVPIRNENNETLFFCALVETTSFVDKTKVYPFSRYKK